MTGWLRNSPLGRALRWRALPGWPWLSLQLLALFLTIQVGGLIASLSWPVRIAVLVPVVLVLFGIADIVADKVDERLEAASERGARS
ncbi:MAG: hypothetical protein ACR2H2_10290 [Solirubrobacteraceae bacterium]